MRTVACRFNLLARSADKIGGGVFGQLKDKLGKDIMVDGKPLISTGNGAPTLVTCA
jgi:hypothetical protein